MIQNIGHRLSKEAIHDFKRIYLEEFKEAITDEEAQEIAQRVIRFFKILTDGKAD
jgi:hypothetical protein